MERPRIAFFPYSYDSSSYISMMQYILECHCDVYNYLDVKNDWNAEKIDVLYFNWIEDSLDDLDRRIIEETVRQGKKVIWVFHNKMSHYQALQKKSDQNISFMMKTATHVFILSHSSANFLYELYGVERNKVYFVPHPNYEGCYGNFVGNSQIDGWNKDDFVFGTIGNIRKDKNVFSLIEAFKLFKYKKTSKLFIAGKPESVEVLRCIQEAIKGESNIICLPTEVKGYSMNYYYAMVDVVMMPYDTRSCMNSGVMMLAFTNRKTVITSNMCMADEYEDSLIYKFPYEEDKLVELLIKEMERAYDEGKDVLKEKGIALYQKVIQENSTRLVEERLGDIIGYNPKERFHYQVAYSPERKCYWLEKLVNDVIQNSFVSAVTGSPKLRIGIYGFGKYGKMIYHLLNRANIDVACIIDQKAGLVDEIDTNCRTLENINRDLDCIIVSTPQVNVYELREKIESLDMQCYVLGLSDL